MATHKLLLLPGDGIGRVRLAHGRVGDRNLMDVVAGAADQTLFDLESS